MSAFRVGMEVQCVDDSSGPGEWADVHPVKGQVYVVTRVRTDSDGAPKLFVDQMTNFGFGFHAWRFRPLVTRKTDISIFTALLNTKSEKELV